VGAGDSGVLVYDHFSDSGVWTLRSRSAESHYHEYAQTRHLDFIVVGFSDAGKPLVGARVMLRRSDEPLLLSAASKDNGTRAFYRASADAREPPGSCWRVPTTWMRRRRIRRSTYF